MQRNANMRHTRIFYKERRHRAGCKVCTVALAPLLQDTTATSKNDRPSTAWAILTHQKMRLSSSRPMSSRTAHAQTLAQEKKSAPNSCFFDRYGRAVDDIRLKPCIAAMLPAGCSAPLEDTSKRTPLHHCQPVRSTSSSAALIGVLPGSRIHSVPSTWTR